MGDHGDAYQDVTTLSPPQTSQPATPRPGAGGWRAALVAAVVAAVVAAAVAVPTTLALVEPAGDGAAATTASNDGTDAAGDAAPAGPTGALTTVADVADAVLPSVARVDVPGRGSGSAVAYREDGHLITNHHVVDGARRVEVTLPDGTRAPAEVVGSDRTTDIAVVRLDTADLASGRLPVPAYGDGLPRVGETAVAIGSPFGLDASVTAGIVSAVGRSVPGTPLADMIQTDAPINPGNSGGALVNGSAEVIGINTAIIGGGAGRGNVGIGFAVPVTTARAIADQLIDEGVVRHAFLGVQGQDVDPAVAELYGLPVREGALVVAVVPETPADAAGLRRGDIITAVDGERVRSMPELAARIRARRPGTEVTLTVLREGEERDVAVTLGEADAG